MPRTVRIAWGSHTVLVGLLLGVSRLWLEVLVGMWIRGFRALVRLLCIASWSRGRCLVCMGGVEEAVEKACPTTD